MGSGKAEPLRIMISGAPASGKGTQCQLITQKVCYAFDSFFFSCFFPCCFYNALESMVSWFKGLVIKISSLESRELNRNKKV